MIVKESKKIMQLEIAWASKYPLIPLFKKAINKIFKETDVTNIVLDAVNIVQKTTPIPKKIFDIKTSCSLLIKGDEYRLREAFVNIIKNAVESLDKEKKNNKDEEKEKETQVSS